MIEDARDRVEAEMAEHDYDQWFRSVCTYPKCDCAIGFPEGHRPGPAECPKFEEAQEP